MKSFSEFIDVEQLNTPDSVNPGLVEVICVGDIYPGRNVEHKALGLGYDYPFMNIGNMLQCDLLCGNLEGVVDNIYGTQIRLKTTPRLSMSSSWIPELKKLGFSVLNVANNHFNDYGKAGALSTIGELTNAEIRTIGTVDNYWIGERNGIRVGFIGCIDNGQFQNTDYLQGLNTIGALIAKVKELADVIVVNVHMGSEYASEENGQQRMVGKAIIDYGANAVIMHHPHVIQDIQEYKGGIIAYSLGNWIFDQDQPGTQKGLSVKMTFDKSKLTKLETAVHTIDDYIINYMHDWQTIKEF